MASEACAIVSQIRFEEQQTLWTKDYEEALATETGDVFPGMMFNLARERIYKSKLWKIVKRMPKGALLHCHLEAMVDLGWLIDQVFSVKGMHVQADAPLSTVEARDTAPVTFQWLSSQADVVTSIWDDSYPGSRLVPVEQAADSFPNGGRDGFTAWLRSRMTITPEESLKHHHGPNHVWRKFTSCFGVLGSLLHYEPIWRGFLRRMLKNLVDDGVQYVDMRAAFVLPYYQTGSETADVDNLNIIAALDEEIEDFKSTEAGKGFWGARLIWTTIRSFNTRQIIESRSSNILFSDIILADGHLKVWRNVST